MTPTLGTIGGCLIEPHGFSSELQDSHLRSISKTVDRTKGLITNCVHVDIPPPLKVVSISEQTGISSNVFNTTFANIAPSMMYKHIYSPLFHYWSPYTRYKGNLRFSDAGGYDTTCILSLLRRKVKKIIACLSISSKLESNNLESTMYAFAGLFGKAVLDKPETIVYGFNSMEFNKRRKVFPAEAWDEVIAGLLGRTRRGDTPTYLLKTRVLPNPFANIQGNFDVTILIVVNAYSEGWCGAIPGTLLEEIRKDHMKAPLNGVNTGIPLDAFPCAFSTRMMYTPVMVNAYSQMSSWSLMESKEMLRNFFEQSP